MNERIDKMMVAKELVKTRSQARMLIKQGDVLCNGKSVNKPGLSVSIDDQIEITQKILYVSRGAHKLVKAIEEFDLDFKGKIIADCGASTGGFTQVCLINGADKVYALDVGHDQLDATLCDDPRVVNKEGVNLKYEMALDEQVDICVADLSFISITKVFLNMKKMLKPNGFSVVLIKPQFEAGLSRIGKGGIVKESDLKAILDEVKMWFSNNGFIIEKFCESPITGKTGNLEYLALIKDRIGSEI
jgi:23S rRNA (cytidine1920-2'-O)/16S rRNA (cytidine1409-2'-O)-methyltransferase